MSQTLAAPAAARQDLTQPPSDLVEHHRVQQFLFREARLMDEHRYDEWLALWAETAHYWIPSRDDGRGIDRSISLVNESRIGIEDRIKRLKSGAHYAQDPRSSLSRVVSNVELIEGADVKMLVSSTFNLTASRRGRIDIIAGRTTHTLLRAGDDFRIAAKRVLLVNHDEVINNLTYLV